MSPWIQAIERRASLLTKETNALRLIDGAGDGMPGIYLEAFADHWLLSTANVTPAPAFLAWLRSQPHSIYHKQLSQQEKDSPQHLSGPVAPEMFLAKEHSMLCEISFHSGYSQGIFLDQRNNRQRVHQAVLTAKKNGPVAILNTFAYTGAFSVAAALAGATTTTLDLSQPYLDWAKRNFTHNQLDPGQHHFCKGDTFHWLRRFQKQGRKFDGIILDPPTFSRSREHGDFRAESDYGHLVSLALPLLSPEGVLLASSNAARLLPERFCGDVRAAVEGAGRRVLQEQYVPQPPDFPISREEPAYLKTFWVRVG